MVASLTACATADECQGCDARTLSDVGLQLPPACIRHDLTYVRWPHVVSRLGLDERGGGSGSGSGGGSGRCLHLARTDKYITVENVAYY